MECNATCPPIYTARGKGVRTDYHSELEIHYSDDLLWKVHIGDVIAISVDALTVEKIETFQPNHYRKASPHWKIGLVTALTQVISPKSQTTHISIQYLNKILDTSFCKDKKIKGTYHPNSQLPHVLVSTCPIHKITPEHVLPVRIQMLAHKEFFPANSEKDEDARHLQFYCPKLLQDDRKLVNIDPDLWAQLNAPKKVSEIPNGIPVPLQKAWRNDPSLLEIPELLPNLVQGFRNAMKKKQIERKAFLEKQRKLSIQQRNIQLQQEKEKDNNNNNKKRQTSLSTSPPPPNSQSGKRVRIQEPKHNNGEEEAMRAPKPVSKKKQHTSILVKKQKEAAKQVIKAAVTKAKPNANNKKKQKNPPKATTKKGRSFFKSSDTTTVTTTSTQSTSSTNKNTKDDASTVTPLGERLVRFQRKEFYQKVQIPIRVNVFCKRIRPKHEAFTIAVGQLVAVREGQSDNISSRSSEPFDKQVQWSPAQVLSIYQSKDSDAWFMQVRWFFYCEELKDNQQEQIRADPEFSSTKGVIESMKVDNIEVESVLAVHIELTSQGDLLESATKHADGLPTIQLSCRHLHTEKAKIVNLKTDWNGYHERLASVPKSLERGLSCLPKSLATKYRELITGQTGKSTASSGSDDDDGILSDHNDDEAESEPLPLPVPVPFEVTPLTAEPIYERWNMQFYDGVRLGVDRRSLVKSFRPKTQLWTIKVGYVVPIHMTKQCLQHGLNAKKALWYPFVQPWIPGQIVSIYKSNETGEWMMQLRWFNHFHHLLERQQAGLESFDKPHVVFETEEYCHVSLSSVFPGRLIITSNDMDDWGVETSFFTGLPLIPRLCAHICVDEEIDCSMDWTNYDVNMRNLPSPLARGLLLDPRNRVNKEWILMLSRCYKKAIQSRGTDADEQVLQKWSGREGRPLRIDDSVAFEPEKVQISAGAEIFSTDTSPRRDFFRALRFTLPVDYIAEPSKLQKRSKKYHFSCKVGDVVCFHDKDAVQPADYMMMKHIKHPWFPYRVPWCYGQILSTHRNEKTDSLCVEIRRFFRFSDLPPSVQAFAPATEDGDREEVFESDLVDDIPASRLLGAVDFFLGDHDRAASCNERSTREKSLVSVRSKFFYLHQVKRIQQLYCSGFTPESWLQRCEERNLSLSNWGNKFEGLRQELSSGLFSDVTLNVADLLGSAEKGQRPLGQGILSSESLSSRRRFFIDVRVSPNWSRFEDFNLFYRKQDQHLYWKIQLGDFVAVKDHNSSQGHSRYPFVDSWIPAQILAIYVEESGVKSRSHGQLCFEVRLLQMKELPNDELPLVEAPVPSRTEIIPAKDLRGPLLICPREESFESKWKRDQKHLPCAPCWASKFLFSELRTSLKESTVYTSEDITEVLSAAGINQTPQSMDVDGGDDKQLAELGTGTAWTATEPFHIDLSQLRAYYSEMNLRQLRQSYAVGLKEEVTRPWSVKMGDVVLVHCDGSKRFPMDCNWSVGEVVAIWKDFASVDEMEKDRQITGAKGNGTPPIEVEIRWLYERHDLQGNRTLTLESSEDFEEVFESDHLDVIQGGDILCPAMLRDDTKDLVQSRKFKGLPIHKYLCRRFWSTTRKSLIPCGKLEGRQRRGWLYSRYFPEEAQEKYATLNASSAGWSNKQTKLTWQESMGRIIGKLTLQDASKGAYERGETLIGREMELGQLLSFFRDAIRGTAGTGGCKSSLFLAGPPGVGKTACVRSAIARLRREQAKGEIPTFNFISLNGMEMRHPFEAYGKFWEALTGCKHVGSHEVASAKLTNLFTSPRIPGMVEDDTVTVLLLDEIDYLITEKQTVLYDFFDWPKRAAELRNGRRLVVVGISNTLNLAEQLLPSVQSRLGAENKVLFKSYNLKDTISILKTKLKEASPDMKIFEDDAILLASKKTAGLSGDIRKAFQICRAAAELVSRNWEANKENRGIQSGHPTVRISDVQKASLETFNISTTTAISFSSSFQALLLVSIASLKRTTGREGSFDIKDIMMKMEAVAGAAGDPQYSPPPSFSETIQLLNSLAERDLIGLATAKSTLISFRSSRGGSGGAWPLVTPKVDDLLVLKGLKKTLHKGLCEKNLPSVY